MRKQMRKECCGTCCYCSKSKETGDLICENDFSDSYSLEVEYRYKCEEYEERE